MNWGGSMTSSGLTSEQQAAIVEWLESGVKTPLLLAPDGTLRAEWRKRGWILTKYEKDGTIQLPKGGEG